MGNWIAIGISEESEESEESGIRLIRHWLCLPKQPWEDWNRRARPFRGMSCCGELPFPQLTQFYTKLDYRCYRCSLCKERSILSKERRFRPFEFSKFSKFWKFSKFSQRVQLPWEMGNYWSIIIRPQTAGWVSLIFRACFKHSLKVAFTVSC